MQAFLIALYAVLSLGSLILLASFRHVSLRELKRRAQEGDEQSRTIYRAATYSMGLGAVLWFTAGVSSSLFFWSLAHYASGWLAVIIGAVFVWTILVWLPTRWQTGLSIRIAATLAPAMSWLLSYLHSIVNPIFSFFARRWPAIQHTGLYDVDDMLDVLDAQHEQTDNRIDPRDLNIAMHALTFGKRQVREIMTARKSVKAVSADESLGPVLMSELHDSGLSCFPVYTGKKGNIVGTLFLSDLIDAKAEGRIKDVMHAQAYYLRQDQVLAETVPELFKPHHHLFVVVDSFDEYVGIVTSKDILHQIIGHPEPEEVQDTATDQENEPTASIEEAPEVVE